jgi:hypothetical protein
MPDDPVQWAESEAQRLHSLFMSRDGTIGATAGGIEFLRRVAGPRSSFYLQAQAIPNLPVYAWFACQTMADLLRSWIRTHEAGFADLIPIEVRVRIDASSDLMEQVETLLDDASFHPAAAVMLAGAALEEFLRGMVEGTTEAFDGGRTIDGYATHLRRLDRISKQEMKEVTAWGGRRNDAAHGHFAEINGEQARLMVAGINVFIRQHSPDAV